jgi:nucleoside-diphosphate-sugar epimerase
VYATSRSPDAHLSYVDPLAQILFDLEQPSTWKNLPAPSHIVWCFPTLPGNMAAELAEDLTNKGCRILLLGSTSAYPPKADELTDERVAVNMTLPRVQSEEYLRKNFGAIILRLAGLYGPDRHVFNWIRRGKIKNTPRYVNLVHIEDVAALCLLALQHAPQGSSYIVSDGTPRLWSDICEYASTQWNIPIPEPTIHKDTGKRLSPQKILNDLKYELRHPDLFKELDEIERGGAGKDKEIQ